MLSPIRSKPNDSLKSRYRWFVTSGTTNLSKRCAGWVESARSIGSSIPLEKTVLVDHTLFSREVLLSHEYTLQAQTHSKGLAHVLIVVKGEEEGLLQLDTIHIPLAVLKVVVCVDQSVTETVRSRRELIYDRSVNFGIILSEAGLERRQPERLHMIRPWKTETGDLTLVQVQSSDFTSMRAFQRQGGRLSEQLTQNYGQEFVENNTLPLSTYNSTGFLIQALVIPMWIDFTQVLGDLVVLSKPDDVYSS